MTPSSHGGGEQLLLRIPRKASPDLQGRVSKQGGEPVLIHMHSLHPRMFVYLRIGPAAKSHLAIF